MIGFFDSNSSSPFFVFFCVFRDVQLRVVSLFLDGDLKLSLTTTGRVCVIDFAFLYLSRMDR